MSYKPQVKVNSEWNGNGLRFATEEEAKRSAYDLFSRWQLCTDHRAAESDEPVQHRLEANGKLVFLVDENVDQGGGEEAEAAAG